MLRGSNKDDDDDNNTTNPDKTTKDAPEGKIDFEKIFSHIVHDKPDFVKELLDRGCSVVSKNWQFSL